MLNGELQSYGGESFGEGKEEGEDEDEGEPTYPIIHLRMASVNASVGKDESSFAKATEGKI